MDPSRPRFPMVGLVGALAYWPPAERLPSRRAGPQRGVKRGAVVTRAAMPVAVAAAAAPAVVLSEYVPPAAAGTPGLVSVIIPTIGRPSMGLTLDALARQTYTEHETIVVDDRERRGAGRARNRGAARASGEFLFFLDDDVILTHRALEHLTAALRAQPAAAYAYGWFMIDGKVGGRVPFDAKRLRHRNFVTTNSLVRTTSFVGFDEGLGRWQDWEMWLRMLAHGLRGTFVEQKLFDTTNDPNGISSDSKALRHALEVLRKRHRILR